MNEQRNRAIRLADYMLLLPEDFAWYTGKELTGLKYKKQEGGWLLVVTANGRTGSEVAFCGGPTITEATALFWRVLSTGAIKWRPNKYG